MSTLTLRTCPICVALAAILFIFPAAVSAQNTISVPGDQATIQSAINVANNGDTVLVAPGTYTENINFNGKAITVTSSAGAAVTIIDGGRIGTVVTFGSAEGPGSVLKGFTIQNGQEYFGAGVTLLGGAPTIVGNVFINNTQLAGGFGAAIGGNSSSPNIEQNIFKGNSCDTQFDSGVVSFVNSSSPLVAKGLLRSSITRLSETAWEFMLMPEFPR